MGSRGTGGGSEMAKSIQKLTTLADDSLGDPQPSVEGNNKIVVTLIEAQDKVDSGKIYKKLSKKFSGYELLNELRASIADITLYLCRYSVEKYPQNLKKAKYQNDKETFYPRRFPKDSRLDLNKSIKEQFNLLRVVDNDRYPAFFEINGHKYYLLIKEKFLMIQDMKI